MNRCHHFKSWTSAQLNLAQHPTSAIRRRCRGALGWLSPSLRLGRFASQPLRRKLIILAIVVVMIDGLGYGVARWRKIVVMQEYRLKEQGLVVRQTGPGWDVRDDWRGRFKNRANPVLFACFRPFCSLEDFVRGSRRAIR